MTLPYADFLAAKAVTAPAAGLPVAPATLPAALFPWQRDIVVWALARGRAALFAECGLGKTLMELAWAAQVAAHTGAPVLILTPLAVAEQTVAEGGKFGVPVTLCETEADLTPGVNVTNYEKLHLFPTCPLGGIVLDESSILKAYMGKTKQALITRFAATRFKLAATATPAPNDHMELGNHSAFLGLMSSSEMLTRWFINNQNTAGDYRLKAHAAADFWRWVSTWAVGLTSPADLRDPATGQPYDAAAYCLPPLRLHTHTVATDLTVATGGHLFRLPVLSATEQHREARLTVAARAARTAELVQSAPGPWVVWCQTNYEADAVTALLPTAVEVRGSDSNAHKTAALRAFTAGEIAVLITKPTIAGFGLNWQHCHQMVFVGLSYSFEQFYQALRRCWRFGQPCEVVAHLIGAETEGALQATLLRKQQEHTAMQHSLVTALQTQGLVLDSSPRSSVTPPVRDVATGVDYTLYLGDCVEATRAVPSNSVGLHVFSPPFADLYMYTPDDRDMGNCSGEDEFFRHFSYLIPELHRITAPGRLCVVHCKDLSRYRNKTGASGLRDFPGAIIRAFEEATIPDGGQWVYHSRVTIWTDPVQEMQRTKTQGLLYSQLRKDSTYSRMGVPDTLVVFRKWTAEGESAAPVTHTPEDLPLEMWQRYASPVWYDVDRTNVLNELMARENPDEKHICPLQLDVIARCIELWSNPGDVVFSPFAGIGSEGYQALRCGRRFVGVELKESYWKAAIKFLERANLERTQTSMAAMLPGFAEVA